MTTAQDMLANLRPYQVDGLKAVSEQIEIGSRRPLLQLPTGGGKTETAIAFAATYLESFNQKRWQVAEEYVKENGFDAFADALAHADSVVGKPEPIVWLTDREELNHQTAARFNKYGLGAAALTSKSFPARLTGVTPQEAIDLHNPGGQVMVISHTVFENRFSFDQFGEKALAFSDECHHDFAPTRLRVVKKWPGILVGLTATPERMSPREGMNVAYDSLVQGLDIGATIRDLEADGYLLPVVVQTAANHLRMNGSKPVAGDFKEFTTSCTEAAFNQQAVKFVYEQTDSGNEPAIWYTTTKDHCLRLAEWASEWVAPHKIGVVISGDDHFDICKENGWLSDRQEIAERLRAGKMWLVLNVMILTEGVDFPGVSVIVSDRPTMSPIVWNQQVGRGRRPDGKAQYCKLISFTDNVSRLGHPSSERRYGLTPRILTPPTRPAPSKKCLQCGMECHAACRNCPKCNAPFGKFCPNCKDYRFWRSWNAASENCDHCVRGAKPPLMFQNGFNDHLKDEILVVSLEGTGAWGSPYKIVWRDSNSQKVTYSESLMQDMDSDDWHWIGQDELTKSELPYYAKIINAELTSKTILELDVRNGLERVRECELLTDEQENILAEQGIDGFALNKTEQKPNTSTLPVPYIPTVVYDEPEVDLDEFLETFQDDGRYLPPMSADALADELDRLAAMA